MIELFYGLSIAMALVVWFKTDAFIEYARLLGVTKELRVDEYFVYNETLDQQLTYPEYLLECYGRYFLIRLITCEVCLSIWLGFLSCRWTCLGCSFIGLSGYLIIAKLLDHGRSHTNPRDRSVSS